MSDNLFTILRAGFPKDLERPFLIERGRPTITYGDLIEITGRMAHRLVALGAKSGDRVAVQAEKSAESLLLFLATLRIGAVYLPLNPAYTLAEVRYFVEDAEPAVLVCRSKDEAAMAGMAAELGLSPPQTLGLQGEGALLAGSEALPGDFEDVARAPDDLAAILYTSGTTGRSKGAMLTHANLRSNAEVLKASWRFTAEDRLIHALPIFHTHGLFVATNIVLVSGGSIIFQPKFDVSEIIRSLPDATVLMGVPTFFTRLLAEPSFDRERTANMRLFVSGSAPLSAETHRDFFARTGYAILERYGMTETNMNTSNPYDGDRVPGSVGFPLPNVTLRIVDQDTGEPLSENAGAGVVGVIEVKGPNVFKGYWRMPEKTAEEFRADGFFATGDLGYRDARGYLFIIGRAKDLIISGGFNIYPVEVENAIDAIDGVAESAVIGTPHSDLGEAVVAVIAVRRGVKLGEAEIMAALADRLARFKQPRRVAFVAELPRNGMGKVQKKDLREQYTRSFAG